MSSALAYLKATLALFVGPLLSPVAVSDTLMRLSDVATPIQIGLAWLAMAACGVAGVWMAERVALLCAILVAIGGLLVAKNQSVRCNFWLANAFKGWIRPLMFDALERVLQRAPRGDAAALLREIDEFCWAGDMLMNVGDVKGPLVDAEIRKKQPRRMAELGAHIGYSTVRFAACLEPDALIYSVDPEPMGHAIKMALLAHAGLTDRVEPVYDFSDRWLKKLAAKGEQLDLLFIDHVKVLYLSDLQLAISLNVLAPGCVVIADNVLTPGAPEYKDWVLNSPLFETKVIETFLEYSTTVPDELLVSVYRPSC